MYKERFIIIVKNSVYSDADSSLLTPYFAGSVPWWGWLTRFNLMSNG